MRSNWQASWRLALNTLGGKPGRAALMIGAVALAAALVMAVSCAIATMQASMEFGITRFVGSADVRIIHQGNGRFSEELLEKVRSWPEVDAATGRLGASLTLIHADHRKDPKTGELLRMTPSALGVDFTLESRFRKRDLTAGKLPAAANEILIDQITAEQLHATVGDVLEVQRFGEPVILTVTGILERPRLAAVQRPIIEMDRRTLAEASDRTGELTSIAIIIKKPKGSELSITVADFCARHQSELPEILSLEPAEFVRSGFNRQVQASRFGFTIASMLTFLSASFIIVTALTVSVTERQREMAVTRCIGASRGQLFGSQMLAGLLLSSAGAVIGIPLGIGLTALLAWYFSEYLPVGVTLHPLGFELAAIGSIGAGILGALYPAWMASHVPPLQAMSVRAQPPRPQSIVLAAIIALLLISIQLALFSLANPSDRFIAYAYAGLPCLLVGYFILSIPLLIGTAALLSTPLSFILGLPAGMVRRSLFATPFRHGFTAGSLMVGMAILVSTWSNMTSILHDWLGGIKFADGFAFRSTGISPKEQQAIAALPFVKDFCPISYLPLRVYDKQIFGVQGLAPPNVTCMGFDPDLFFSMNALEWVAGDPQTVIPKLKAGTALIVADRFLTTQKVKIGDHLTLGVGKVRKDFEIAGAVNSAGLDIAVQAFGIRSQYMEYSISCVFVDWKTLNETFDNRDAHLLQINIRDDDSLFSQGEIAGSLRDPGGVDETPHPTHQRKPPGITDEEIIKQIAEVAPGVQFYSGRWIVKTINNVATGILVVDSTVAFAALALACLGVGNVILANIVGRKYEFGVLRAVGANKSLIAKLILAEVAIIAIAGALVGTLLGIHLAWVGVVHYRDLAGLPVTLVLPQLPTAIGWLVLIALTLLAAIPGVRSVVKRQPSALLAGGRNG